MGFSKSQLLSSLCSSSCFSRQSSFFTRLAPAWEFIGQNRLADTDNKEAQRGICLSPRIRHPNNEQELVWPVHKHYLLTTITKYPANLVMLKKRRKVQATFFMHAYPISLCSQEMGEACMITNLQLWFVSLAHISDVKTHTNAALKCLLRNDVSR